LGNSFFNKHKWLAVSNSANENLKGAWCIYCAIFQTTNSGGGRGSCGGIGGNQQMGALVNTPLRNFKKNQWKRWNIGYP
jgi:hypothetical protein